jgi:hypothetical protein
MHVPFARVAKMRCYPAATTYLAVRLVATLDTLAAAAVGGQQAQHPAEVSGKVPLGGKWVEQIASESGLRQSTKVCPELRIETPGGTVVVRESHVGEAPDIILPRKCDYVGLPPESLECAWVNRACDVGSVTASQWGNCWNIYNITRRGQGLTSWPSDLTPKLVSGVNYARGGPSIAPTGFGAQEQDLAGVLPETPHASDFMCRPPPADLDFASAKMSRGAGALIYRGLVKGMPHERTVDLIISKGGSLEAPKGQYTSAGGRIVMTRGDGQTNFKFQFVDSMSQIPVALSKVFITLFDIDNGLDRKEISVAGLSDYYLSSDTWLQGREYPTGAFRFFSGMYQSQQESDGTLDGMWRNSQRRTIVLAFKDISEFTIGVRPLPCTRCHSAVEGEECYENAKWAKDHGVFEHPEWYPGLDSNSSIHKFQTNLFKKGLHKCQRPCESCNADDSELSLEFAGWSNLVQVGRKVECESTTQVAKFSMSGRREDATKAGSSLLQVICFSLAAVAVSMAALAIVGRTLRITPQAWTSRMTGEVRGLKAIPLQRTRAAKRALLNLGAHIVGENRPGACAASAAVAPVEGGGVVRV